MQIVQLTASRFFGSLEWQIVELARALPTRYRTTIASFHEGGHCQSFLDQAQQSGLHAVALEHDTPHFWSAIREISALLRASGADVVCCHGYKANLLGRRAARRVGIPAISISHGWTGESRRVRLYEAFDRRRLPQMDRVVCVSDRQAAKVRAAGVPQERIRVIRNAVDVERFDRPDSAYREALETMFPVRPSRIIGAAGRLSPEKGFDVLIRAAEIALRRDSSLGFVIFGQGPLQRELEEQIAAAGLKKQIVLAGFTNHLDRYLPFFDLLVLSSYTEGLPCIVLEALAAQVPVVATAVGGTPEVLEHGKSGWLTPAGDAAALADRILASLACETERQAMGRYGRQQVLKRFSFAKQSRAYQELFAEIVPVAGRRSRSALPVLDGSASGCGRTRARGSLTPAVSVRERAFNGGLDEKNSIANAGSAAARPVRVCFVIDRLNAAGTERQLLSLIKRLDRRRVEPLLCLLDGSDARSAELLPRDCEVLRLGVKSLRSLHGLRQAFVLRRFLQRHQVDVVQLHFPDSTYFAAPVARLSGVARVVGTRRDLGYWMRPRDHWLAKIYNRFLIDATIANCEACRQSMIDGERVPPNRVLVCENGIDCETYESIPPLPMTGGGRRLVGMVANLRTVKDPESFVQAAVELCRERDDVDFHLAGEGELAPKLAELIAANGLEHRIVLDGSVSAVEFLSRIEIAVLCSRSEGLSNSVLEYMAAGRAIVVTRVGGNPELIEDGVHGLVVAPADVPAMTMAIRRLLDDTAMAARLGAAARRRASERFSWSIASRRLEYVYASLLGRPLDARAHAITDSPPSDGMPGMDDWSDLNHRSDRVVSIR